MLAIRDVITLAQEPHRTQILWNEAMAPGDHYFSLVRASVEKLSSNCGILNSELSFIMSEKIQITNQDKLPAELTIDI